MIRIVGAAFLVALLSTEAPLAQESRPDRYSVPHVAVIGSAEQEVRPDIAVLRIGVVNEKRTANEAMSENSRLAAAAIARVKSLGVDAKDIRTSNVSLTPIIDDERDPKTNAVIRRALRGYQASNLIDVTIRDVETAGAIASSIVESGANTYRGLSFQISDQDARLDDLRAKAVADAMRKAALYAHGASMKLGRLLVIDAGPNRYSGVEAMRAAAPAQAGGGPIPIEPGVKRLRLEVSATWELIPE
jgi:uncharacterized protein YggE